MDRQLNGKRALVTGATGGIGAVIARTLAAEGAAVAVHGRRLEDAQALADEIMRAGGTAAAVAGDLADDAGADAVAQGAEAGLGGVDVLVNNAGHYENRSFEQITAADWLDIRPFMDSVASGRNEPQGEPTVLLSGDMAITISVLRNDFKMKDGSQFEAVNRQTLVWRREEGGWRIAHEHTSPVP